MDPLLPSVGVCFSLELWLVGLQVLSLEIPHILVSEILKRFIGSRDLTHFCAVTPSTKVAFLSLCFADL